MAPTETKDIAGKATYEFDENMYGWAQTVASTDNPDVERREALAWALNEIDSLRTELERHQDPAEVLGNMLCAALAESTFKTTRVQSASWRLDSDSMGDDALFLELILEDPLGETWDYDDILAIRRQVFAVVGAAETTTFDGNVIVRFSPVTGAPQDGE